MNRVNKSNPRGVVFLQRAGILFTTTIILFFRKQDAFLNPQFWAEDGLIFFHQCHVFGLKSVVMLYAGYLHTIPRILAYLTSFGPITLAPAIFNYTALVLMLLACAYILTNRVELKQKMLLAVFVALVPYNGVCYMNLTNVQWILAPLLLMPLLQKPPGRSVHIVMDFTMLLMLGLTGPFIVLCLPLYLHRWYRDRGRYWTGVCLVSAGLATVQFILLFTMDKDRGVFDPEGHSWISLIAFRGAGDLLFGRAIAERIPSILLLLFVLLLPAGILLLARGERRRFYSVSVFLYLASTSFLATLFKHRATPDALLATGSSDGYFFMPYLLVIWALVQCLSFTRFKGLISAGLLTMILISTCCNFKAEPLVDYHWKEYCEKLNTTHLTEIPLNPPGWSMRLKLRPE